MIMIITIVIIIIIIIIIIVVVVVYVYIHIFYFFPPNEIRSPRVGASVRRGGTYRHLGSSSRSLQEATKREKSN